MGRGSRLPLGEDQRQPACCFRTAPVCLLLGGGCSNHSVGVGDETMTVQSPAGEELGQPRCSLQSPDGRWQAWEPLFSMRLSRGLEGVAPTWRDVW